MRGEFSGQLRCPAVDTDRLFDSARERRLLSARLRRLCEMTHFLRLAKPIAAQQARHCRKKTGLRGISHNYCGISHTLRLSA
jgi:hypothetical protein